MLVYQRVLGNVKHMLRQAQEHVTAYNHLEVASRCLNIPSMAHVFSIQHSNLEIIGPLVGIQICLTLPETGLLCFPGNYIYSLENIRMISQQSRRHHVVRENFPK